MAEGHLAFIHNKIGPLEAWQWAGMVAGLAAIYYVIKQRQANAGTTSTASSTGAMSANAGIDPVTGIPYSEENLPGGAATTSSTGDTAASLGTELGDVTGLAQGFTALQAALNPNGTAGTGAASTAPEFINAPAGSTLYDPNTGTLISVPGVTVGAQGPQGVAGPGKSIAAPNHTQHPTPAQVSLFEAAIGKALQNGVRLSSGGSQILSSLQKQGFSDAGHAGTYTKKGSADKYFVYGQGAARSIRKAAPPAPHVSGKSHLEPASTHKGP